MTVTLSIEDWQKVLGVLAGAPWATVNPLIMAIGEQLRQQTPRPNGPLEPSEARQEPIRQ